MSIRVVSESHQINDDYVWVPSDEEFDELVGKVSSLMRKVTSLTSKYSAVERGMKSLEASLRTQKDLLASLRKDMVKELSGGEWRQIVEKTIEDSVRTLEISLRECSLAGAQRISAVVAERMTKNDSSVCKQGVKVIASKLTAKSSRRKKTLSRKR